MKSNTAVEAHGAGRGSATMASIQEEIHEEFYSKLAKAEGFDKERVEHLRSFFSGKKKPKTPDVIKALGNGSV